MKCASIAAAALLLAGCQSDYYRITDIESGKEFYTKAKLALLYGRNGSIHFKELGTGDDIVLQSSRAHLVTEVEAREAVKESTPRK